jgi:hypothetical protein
MKATARVPLAWPVFFENPRVAIGIIRERSSLHSN